MVEGDDGGVTHAGSLDEGGELHADGDSTDVEADGAAGAESDASQSGAGGEGLTFGVLIAHGYTPSLA